MNESETQNPMSPAAVDRRLRDLSQLWEFGMTIKNTRRLGKVRDREARSPASTWDTLRDEAPHRKHKNDAGEPAFGRSPQNTGEDDEI